MRVSWRPQLYDPDDEMVLEAAINGVADAIVPFEVKTFLAPARRFGIGTPTPANACGRLSI
jgi:predicted nucleic acid-binding protein